MYAIKALMPSAADLGRSLKGYIGSVAMSRDGTTLAAAAPRAGRTLLIDIETGQIRSEILLRDGCGIAAVGSGFVLSSGHGRLVARSDGGGEATIADLPDLAFDNHLRWLAG